MRPAAVEIRPVAFGTPTWEAVRAIRQRVFVEEQACPPEEEWDGADATARHLLLLDGGVPAGCARWRVVEAPGGGAPGAPRETTAKLERFAVLPEHRGRGHARALVARALADAEAAGHALQVLYAQAHLEAFYGAFGFRRSGPDFWEAGLRHTPMHRVSGGKVGVTRP